MAKPSRNKSAGNWVLESALDDLIRRKARRLARSGGFNRSDIEDIEQDLRLHLATKTHKFDSSRASHVTFASRILTNKIKSMQRTATSQKCDYRRNEVSLNDELMDGEGRSVERVGTFDTSAGRRHTGQRIPSAAELKQLSIDVAETNRPQSEELRTFAALLSHVSKFAAAQVMGITRRRAEELHGTLRTLYEERGLSA